MKLPFVCAYALATLAACSAPDTSATGAEASATSATSAATDGAARLDWWREARFGMFLHWGLYSIPAGAWKGSTNHAEWIRTTANIPVDEYERFLPQFNPVKFDADAWVRAAKGAGMRYIVITSKHHDGFGLFDSSLTDWDVMSTPFRRDILKELAAACAQHGLKMCWYHSIMDWHHPDYLPRRDWEKRSSEGADMERFVQYLHGQVTELLTRYGPIGVMWFDGEWESTWNHERGQALYDLCRTLQPNVIVNNRVDVGRAGMAGMTKGAGYAGDFGTPEQEVPATGFPGIDWESCITMNDHWGYNAADRNWKSAREMIEMLSDIASKGGNLLLNIGPMASGEFPPEAVERLADMGRWMKVNGDAIHGTGASPMKRPAWGRITTTRRGSDTRLNLIVFEWPTDGRLVLEGIGNDVRGAGLLGDPATKIAVHKRGARVEIALPKRAPGAEVSVVTLDLAGEPIVYELPEIRAVADVFVGPIDIELALTSKALELRYTLDGSEPTSTSPRYAKPLRIERTTVVAARAFHHGAPVSGTVRRSFQQIDARPAVKAEVVPGLTLDSFPGAFDRMPAFASLSPEASSVAATVTLGTEFKGRENVALRFSGYVLVPADELYLFDLESDDGSRLWIDEQLVVDNDGLHGPVSKRGGAALAAGLHALRVEWFNRGGGSVLDLKVATPGVEAHALGAHELLRATGK